MNAQLDTLRDVYVSASWHLNAISVDLARPINSVAGPSLLRPRAHLTIILETVCRKIPRVQPDQHLARVECQSDGIAARAAILI
jgi:hypothetical protein